MGPIETKAIADYFKDGGQINKFDAPIVTTLEEVVSYLATDGEPIRYFEGDARPYRANGRRYSTAGLVGLANNSRRKRGLAPFAVREDPGPRRTLQPKDL